MNINTIRKNIKKKNIYGLSVVTILRYIASGIFIIAVLFQIKHLLKIKKANDYSLYFIILQIIGTPEGGGAAITGYMTKNYSLLVSGLFGFIYYIIALYFKLYPK
tara:strand:- start:543 stop:857 length:315 start_codon:yes stop_codon:yes gene_type:complete